MVGWGGKDANPNFLPYKIVPRQRRWGGESKAQLSLPAHNPPQMQVMLWPKLIFSCDHCGRVFLCSPAGGHFPFSFTTLLTGGFQVSPSVLSTHQRLFSLKVYLQLFPSCYKIHIFEMEKHLVNEYTQEKQTNNETFKLSLFPATIINIKCVFFTHRFF